jgi:hypothetical protein
MIRMREGRYASGKPKGEADDSARRAARARLDKTTEEVAGMTWDELVGARDDVQRQIDELNARIAVLEAAQAVARNNP